jgi:hypothetical protein
MGIKRTILVVIFCLFVTGQVYSEGYVVEWTRTYNSALSMNDWGEDIAVDSAGNVYVTGVEKGNPGDGDDIWTRKYDKHGNVLWTSTYNSPNNSDDWGRGIAVDDNGNVYVTGVEYRDDLGQLDNIWTRKYDPDGFEIWTSTYNSPANGWDHGKDIAVDSAGNVYVIGDEQRTDIGQDYNIWIRKYDPDGYELWTSTYNSPNNWYDKGCGIAVDDAGNVYVTGYENRGDLGQSENIWTRKYDTDGFEIWTSTYNSPANSADWGLGIAVDSAGNVYVTGFEDRSDLGQDDNVWTRKYDTDGYEVWTFTYNSPSNGYDQGRDVAVDSLGNVYVIGFEEVTGFLNYDIWTRRYDTDGNVLWTSSYNSPNNSADNGFGIAVDSNKNVYVTGFVNRSDLGEGENIWTRKYRIVYDIKGIIQDKTGNPIEGVSVNLSGYTNSSVTTSATGYYEFVNIPGGEDYTITPTKLNYTFLPERVEFTTLDSDKTQNFIGKAVNYNSLRVYPNPVRGERGDEFIRFENVPYNTKIRIYNIAGDLVNEITNGNVYYVEWDLTNKHRIKVVKGKIVVNR